MERNDYLKMLVEEMHSTTMATIGDRPVIHRPV